MQKLLEKVKIWGKENALVLLYFLLAILVEMTAVFVVEGTPFLTRPFLSLGLLVFVCGIILFVKSNKARTIICTCMLALQAVLDLVFSVIFDMTDQYFDMGMLSLRNDAFAILENIPVDFITFYVGLAVCVAFLIFGLRFSYAQKSSRAKKKSAFFYVGLMAAGLASLGISFVCYYPRSAQDKYDQMIKGRAASAYSAYGMLGNLLGEAGNALFKDRTPMDEETINTFIYEKTVGEEDLDYFGVSENNNVLMILAESLEWYTFLADGENASMDEYPKSLQKQKELGAADLAFLYPNLTEYYQESVVMTNFHGREKTDIAETTSILGSYPTGAYINYDYEENTLPQTVPNILKEQTDDISVYSFHNGFKEFYNRVEAHKILGFERLVDMNEMEEMSNEAEDTGNAETFYDYMDEGERNLDSEMVATAKDIMFPTDKRFYSYITTITMHGMYYDRENLRPENNTKLAEQIKHLQTFMPQRADYATDYEFQRAEGLYYYMVTGLEFDYMLGLIKDELQSRPDERTATATDTLWDNTTIVLFGDHNAYYEHLSNYVKDIPDYDSQNKYTDLYNVPLFIRDSKLTSKIAAEGGERIIDKFTCTADIAPTLLGLLGISYYENLYYGHSIFSDEESVLYSRAYDIFLSDGILRRSVRGEFYRYAGNTETGVPVSDTIAHFEEEGEKLVEKIKYCDYIFRQDHFGIMKQYKRFQENMKALNGW